METDNDCDVAADHLDAAKLKAYTETMAPSVKGKTDAQAVVKCEPKSAKPVDTVVANAQIVLGSRRP